MTSFPRLYAILDVNAAAAFGFDPEAVAAAWFDAGVRLVQLRAKSLALGPMHRLAERIARRAEAFSATFIVNDRADVARLAGANGVHVGQEDLRPAEIRRLLPAHALVGLSTHSQEQFERGLREPVSYLAIGPVFPTRTKERADPVVGLDGVRWASAVARPVGLPVVGIGGITIDAASEVLAAGAASVAVISGLLADDVGARARLFLRAVESAREHGGSGAQSV